MEVNPHPKSSQKVISSNFHFIEAQKQQKLTQKRVKVVIASCAFVFVTHSNPHTHIHAQNDLLLVHVTRLVTENSLLRKWDKNFALTCGQNAEHFENHKCFFVFLWTRH